MIFLKKICANVLLTSFYVVPAMAFVQSMDQPQINVAYDGWLDQYSMDKRHDFIGNEACEPTSSTNALTYLQNVAPQVFGTQLSGSTYANWEDTDDVLIKVMGTTKKNGTYDYLMVYGLHTYITEMKDFPEVRFSGMYPNDTWYPAGGYPKPPYITHGKPTVEFITTALAGGGAVLLNIQYPKNEGGHEILANGIYWDPDAKRGTLYFVDPLDSSQNYSPDIPLGPVKQTEGLLTLSKEGHLVLHYNQYEKRLPFTDQYQSVSASVFGALVVGGAPHTPFAQLLPTGNNHAIAAGFDRLDPTTEQMFPLLTVLNTVSNAQLTETFNQFDPSVFNALLFTEQSMAEQVQHVIAQNLLQYRHACDHQDRCCERCSVWLTPFTEAIRQDGSKYSWAKSGYKNQLNGGVVGIDCLFLENFLVGGGASYAESNVDWLSAKAKGHIHSYGGFIYGALLDAPLWLDVGFAYAYNRIKAHRNVFSAAPVSFFEPIEGKFKHHNCSQVYTGHLGMSYDLATHFFCRTEVQFWPYLNLDYIYAHQPSYRETGGDVLALHVHEKGTNLFRPEVGLGCSVFFPMDCYFKPFAHVTLGYAKEVRFQGKSTRAYFADNPESEFKVSGLFPENDLFCPQVQIGVSSPSEVVQLQLTYRGAFGSGLTANEGAAELKFAF